MSKGSSEFKRLVLYRLPLVVEAGLLRGVRRGAEGAEVAQSQATKTTLMSDIASPSRHLRPAWLYRLESLLSDYSNWA